MAETVQAVFTRKLDLVQRMANCAFRWQEWGEREESKAEVVARTWQLCVEAAQRGECSEGLTVYLAGMAIRHVRAGNRMADSGVRNDVARGKTQRRFGYGIGHLSAFVAERPRGFTPDTVCTVCDLADWLDTLPVKEQVAVCHLAEGHTEREVASRVGCGQTTVNSWRRKWLLTCPVA